MRLGRRSMVPILVVVASAAAMAADAQPAGLDAYVDAARERQQIPGLSIAVVRNGELVHARGHGFANVEHGVPATERTVYQSGSIGKQFTATLVMQLVEDDAIELDDRLAEHIVDAPAAWQAITVRHLLNHTSGLSNAIYERIDLRRDYSEDDLQREIAALPLDFAPGDRWNYSNPGYVMLGVLIRNVTGRFYGDLLRARIFEPLGMETARVIGEADIVPNRAAGYRLVDGKLKNQEWVSPTLNTTADGALYLTVLDLAKWDAALTNATVLPQASLDRMWTPAELNDGTTAPYGFGWELGEVAGRRFVAHGGRWQGFATHIVRYLDDKLTVAVLTNLSQANPGRIARAVAGYYEPVLAPPTRTEIAVDPALLELYAGTYELEPGESVEIALVDGALWARPRGQASARLFPFSDSEFFVAIADVEFEFVQTADGGISHLVLHTPGGPREARKVD